MHGVNLSVFIRGKMTPKCVDKSNWIDDLCLSTFQAPYWSREFTACDEIKHFKGGFLLAIAAVWITRTVFFTVQYHITDDRQTDSEMTITKYLKVK